jgi:hypothetical protein
LLTVFESVDRRWRPKSERARSGVRQWTEVKCEKCGVEHCAQTHLKGCGLHHEVGASLFVVDLEARAQGINSAAGHAEAVRQQVCQDLPTSTDNNASGVRLQTARMYSGPCLLTGSDCSLNAMSVAVISSLVSMHTNRLRSMISSQLSTMSFTRRFDRVFTAKCNAVLP